MRTAYVEMIGGASGNMLLGALIDAGADAAAIERALQTIPVSGWTLTQTRVVKCGIAALYVDFAIPGEDHGPGIHEQHGHHLVDVLDIIARSGLSAAVRERACAIYQRLGAAEARVHGTTVDAIHFHEVGQIDAILDVAGVCVALEILGVEHVACSAFPLGTGEISMHHGRYPNPPPATAELLRGAPTVTADVRGEMVTTTAAAILATLVGEPGRRPAMTVDAIGYGAGRSDFTIPNVTRISVGSALDSSPLTDEVVVLETNIDDMPAQGFELAIERLFAAGALDVWTTPIGMKKHRPAVMLSALAAPAHAPAVARTMLEQTSTIGVRTRRETRYVLPREIVRCATPFGDVRIKLATSGERTRGRVEYDDAARIAREHDLPLAEVLRRLQPFVERAESRDRES